MSADLVSISTGPVKSLQMKSKNLFQNFKGIMSSFPKLQRLNSHQEVCQ